MDKNDNLPEATRGHLDAGLAEKMRENIKPATTLPGGTAAPHNSLTQAMASMSTQTTTLRQTTAIASGTVEVPSREEVRTAVNALKTAIED